MSIDPKLAAESFAKLEERLRQIPRDQLQEPRANLQRAANAALSVAEQLTREEVRARFVELAARGGFDLGLLDDLPLAAAAAWHVRQQVVQAGDAGVEPQLPVALFQQATALRARMIKVLDYHRGEDPVVAARLAAIRGGKGHQDLASDLATLAGLYRQHRASLADDHRHYRASDEEEAHRVAASILTVLAGGSGPELAHWTEMQSRVWTLLQRAYDEVRRAGHYLFYYEDPEDRFPSLYAAARSSRGG